MNLGKRFDQRNNQPRKFTLNDRLPLSTVIGFMYPSFQKKKLTAERNFEYSLTFLLTFCKNVYTL